MSNKENHLLKTYTVYFNNNDKITNAFMTKQTLYEQKETDVLVYFLSVDFGTIHICVIE